MATPKNKGGRPTVFTQEVSDRARKLAEEGKTDLQIARALGVSLTTLKNWKKKHIEFVSALVEGKQMSDEKVELALFERAIGYSHADVDIRAVGGEIVQTKFTKHYAPEVSAAIFWLKNRKPKEWRDKVETGVTDKDGNDVPIDPVEAARRIAFLFHKAMGA